MNIEDTNELRERERVLGTHEIKTGIKFNPFDWLDISRRQPKFSAFERSNYTTFNALP